MRISIHAPTRGATVFSFLLKDAEKDFNPRSHEGSDDFPWNILILSILVDTFISKISFPMQPGPEIGSISDA